MRTYQTLIVALTIALLILISCTTTPQSDLIELQTRVVVLETAVAKPTTTPTPNSIAPPEHMAYVWWTWPADATVFQTLEWDLTIHNDPGDFSDEQGLYLMVAFGSIAGIDFYFGLQTDVYHPTGGRGKGLIFSRWGTRDLENARIADQEEGWTQSSGHEGDFIGVRRDYDWGAGDYRVALAPDGSEPDGEWYGVWITNKASGEETWIGSLKFPHVDGEAAITAPLYSTMEIYGQPIIAADIPLWHVSMEPPLGDGVEPLAFRTGYDGFDIGITNSNIAFAPDDQRVHIIAGGATERTDDALEAAFD